MKDALKLLLLHVFHFGTTDKPSLEKCALSWEEKSVDAKARMIRREIKTHETDTGAEKEHFRAPSPPPPREKT